MLEEDVGKDSVNIVFRYFDKVEVEVLISETIILRGLFSLCILGRP